MRYILFVFLLSILASSVVLAADKRWERSLSPEVKDAPQPVQSVAPSSEEVPSLDVEKMKKILEMLKESPTPLRTPDVMLKVLFLPYTDSKGVLHNYKDTFLKVEEGRWVIGDYLKAPGAKTHRMMLRPLDSPLPPLPPRANDSGKDKKTEKDQSANMSYSAMPTGQGN